MYWCKRLLIVGILAMGLLGCREVHIYEYKYVELDLFDGALAINTEGEYGHNYEKDGKKLANYSFPYYIQFTYVVTVSDDLSKIIIKDAELFGEKTKTRHMLEGIESEKVKDYGEKRQIRISLGPLTAEEYKYQNYRGKATIIIYKTATEFEEKTIEVLLETDYKKERRSDKFDEIMSV